MRRCLVHPFLYIKYPFFIKKRKGQMEMHPFSSWKLNGFDSILTAAWCSETSHESKTIFSSFNLPAFSSAWNVIAIHSSTGVSVDTLGLNELFSYFFFFLKTLLWDGESYKKWTDYCWRHWKSAFFNLFSRCLTVGGKKVTVAPVNSAITPQNSNHLFYLCFLLHVKSRVLLGCFLSARL